MWPLKCPQRCQQENHLPQQKLSHGVMLLEIRRIKPYQVIKFNRTLESSCHLVTEARYQHLYHIDMLNSSGKNWTDVLSPLMGEWLQSNLGVYLYVYHVLIRPVESPCTSSWFQWFLWIDTEIIACTFILILECFLHVCFILCREGFCGFELNSWSCMCDDDSWLLGTGSEDNFFDQTSQKVGLYKTR